MIPIPFRDFAGCHSPRPATRLPQRDSSPLFRCGAALRKRYSSCWCTHAAQAGALAKQPIVARADVANDAMPQNTH